MSSVARTAWYSHRQIAQRRTEGGAYCLARVKMKRPSAEPKAISPQSCVFQGQPSGVTVGAIMAGELCKYGSREKFMGGWIFFGRFWGLEEVVSF
jgi:hypothetical protein